MKKPILFRSQKVTFDKNQNRICREVAFKRALALLIDYIVISSIVLIPAAFHSASSWPIDYISLLLTPLPLVYWRLFFKVMARINTPGEQITGIASFAKRFGPVRWASEIGCALNQYFQLVTGLSVAVLTFILSIDIGHSYIAGICISPFVFLLPLYFGNLAASSFSNETTADTALERTVKLIE